MKKAALLLLWLPFAGAFLAGPFDSCPRNLDCTLQRREFCLPGSGTCGPCLPQFTEDAEGRCTPKTPAMAAAVRASLPNLEEEIDLVANAASQIHLRQNGTGTTTPRSPPSRVGAQKSRKGSPAATAPVESSPVESPRLSSNDALILGMIVVCTAAGIAALVVAAVCWCRLQKELRLAQKADYLTQRVPGPPSYDAVSPGDKKLAQSAQMFHYQHQKQQMLSVEKQKEETKPPESASSDEENEDGDFTVYECPGLAPTGEMEVKNPLFDDASLHPPLPLPPSRKPHP
nr:neural proliferation differentiation and control protein 1 isoform X1 [Anolis sagrei ordinatus]